MRHLQLGSGIFDMDFIGKIDQVSDLKIAIAMVFDHIDASTALPKNKAKAKLMVSRCYSIDALVLGMSNFMLAHAGMGVS